MRFIGKLIVIIVVVLLIGTTAYGLYYFYGGTNNNNNNDHGHNETDTEPPTITFVTGNVTVIAGQTVTISAEFSDNVGVSEATLSYMTANASAWIPVSILTGSVSLTIPATATENYYYYVTVNDAAGNGPVGDPSIDGSRYFIITVVPQGGGGNQSGNKTFTHQVFIEESTSTSCHFCPNVGKILHDLESSSLYQNLFYYVSMVIDNSKAAEYINTAYNRSGDPTVYIDGGYNVILGGLHPEINYSNAILAAKDRPVPQVRVTVTADYQNATRDIHVVALVENNESVAYTGTLRVYLLEIISTSYNDYDGQRYRNAFVDFVINQEITVPEKGQKSYSANWSVGSLLYENLKVIAAVFNTTGHQSYSAPPNGNPFTAHYADAVNATYVVKGVRDLPPEVGIVSPQKGKIYYKDKLILKFLYKTRLRKNTWVIGKSTISAYAKDDSGIAKVEFYLDGKLVANMTKPPYNWTTSMKFFKKPLLPHKYTITVKAYDDTNKNATASITIMAWRVFDRFAS
jgi:hypothetical protein